MPYESAKQRRWAHTKSAKKAGFPTDEWDAEERKHNEAKNYGRKVARKKKRARKKSS